ncbi:MAG: shikimate kinase [Candidatus Omnitrophica bacterium]|nr:shikimate kinase [Candidatus Omnitrophota bacterium]
MKNIIVTGFMGTGKTTIAKVLAKELGRVYVSIDERIEKREGEAITDIFKNKGEPYFRKLEKEIIEIISKKTGQVIDTGGGAILNEENRINLKKNGIIICFWSEPRVIFERTKKYVHRPLLNVENPEERIKELLEMRRARYEKADFHIDTTDFDMDGIIKKINEIMKKQKD